MKTKKDIKITNFDDFASKYDDYISTSIQSIDNNLSYYHDCKAKITKREINFNPNNILDFGCGVGILTKYLIDYFPDSQMYAYDNSEESLKYLKEKLPKVICLNNLNTDKKFDLIFLSNVIHHVTNSEREDLFKKIYSLLNEKGQLIIFEHNPLNPVTLKIVAKCEFDKDAELIKKKNLVNICLNNKLKVINSGYIHFFPSKLKLFFGLEKYLKWLFLGAQYFCIFEKEN
tara:strand:+ start:46 stop:735 length:690 start_codon:yes stop_codon:yes gene_type:complete